MGKKSTRINIAFFSLLLVAFIVIQYSWLISLQKEKSNQLRSHLISGLHSAGEEALFTRPLHELTDTAITGVLNRSFSSHGLANIKFEFSVASNNNRLNSPGFNQKLTDDTGNLVLKYSWQQNAEKKISDCLLTVVVPSSDTYIWKGMAWTIAASLLLTIMIVAIFCYAFILGERWQQLFYYNRTIVIKNIMQQMETPLSTMSVATEALRNAKVMHDSAKISYYQQIIKEESQRMNEQVKKLRHLK